MKRGYSANSPITSPTKKKPNIEKLEELTEGYRMRKELIVAQEADEEIDYHAGGFQNSDEDDDDDDDENLGNDSKISGSVVIERLVI